MSYKAKERYRSVCEASRYDRARFHGLRRSVLNRLDLRAFRRGLAFAQPHSAVLDVACGTGRFTELALQCGHEVMGVDISQQMLDVAAERLAGYSGLMGLRVADAENLTFADGEFDCVVSSRFLVHIPRDLRSRVLFEMARVARKYVIVEYPIRSATAMLRRNWLTHVRKSPACEPDMDTPADARDRLRELGLDIVAIIHKLPLDLANAKVLVLRKGPATCISES